MANFNMNKAIIAGRLVADPELKTTASGIFVTSFTVAVNRRGKTDETDFIKVTAWRQTAEFVAKYFKRGSSICLEGSIQNRTYEDTNGNKRVFTEIVADQAYFVDSKSDAAPVKSGTKDEPAPVELGDDEELPF